MNQEFDEQQDDNPVVDNGQVDSGVKPDPNDPLDEALKTLPPTEPAEPPPQPVDVEPPKVELMDFSFDQVEKKLQTNEPPPSDEAETPEDRSEEELEVPGELLADERPDTLLEHFKKLVDKDKELAKPDESVSLPEASAEYEDSASGFQSEGDGQRTYMDADYRNRDASAWMLVDHARRIDELTERLERIRL